ncbi:hypothetical protein QQF64_002530 [Cirrhinus molitorella]|uniref:Histone H2A n=1 Tax=Cirrhinus molitorella TaxID=172907 RepID=A0ABR3MQG5_9TELE
MTYATCVMVKDCVSLTMKKKKTKPVTDLSSRAGLVFPVEHFQQTFSDGRTVDEEAAVFLAGVLEFLVAEILCLAGQDAVLNQSNKITLHHLPGLQDRKRYLKLLELSQEKEEEGEEESVGVAT